MKTIAEIDVTKRISKIEFATLFAHLPTNAEEKKKIKGEYYDMYEAFIQSETEPVTAWIATRNIFLLKEKQIGDRKKSNTIGIAGTDKNSN